MATQVQLRRGTAAENDAFTGAQGEVTVDTTNDTLRVHDGSLAGGYAVLGAKGGSITGNVDVTGTVTADVLTVDGNVTFSQEAASSPYPEQQIKWSNDSTTANGFYISQDSNRNGRVWHEQGLDIKFGTANTERMLIDYNGDISFYEDTGTTPKLFWDASAESLGIGTTSPSTKLDVIGGVGTGIRIGSNQNETGTIQFFNTTASSINSTISGNLEAGNNGGDIRFATKTTSGSLTERMRIDSSGNLILKATSDVGNRLQINGADETSELLEVGITSGYAQFTATHASGGSNTAGFIFRTRNGTAGTNEKMRLDASGNLLVGTTTFDSAIVGVGLGADGLGYFTRDGNRPLIARRKTSDGEIAAFYKDGTQVGSIGNRGTVLFIEGAGSNQVGLEMASDVLPRYNQALDSGGNVDIGASGYRFKDLYLSGGVYLGGTGSANHLDDYEEGTWTATLASGATTNPTTTGYYTKVGRMVTAYMQDNFGSITVNGTQYQISGLPFSTSSNANLRPAGYLGSLSRAQYQSNAHHFCRVEASSTTVLFQYNPANAGGPSDLLSESSGTYTPNFQFTIIYFVD